MLAFAARVNSRELLNFCSAVVKADRRLVALWGSDERDRDEKYGYAVHVAFDLAEGLVCLTLPLASENPVFPDLSLLFPCADRMQRAVRDLTGASAEAGDQRPWLRHANWPAEHYPLRRDTPDARFASENENYAFVRVEGDGVHEIPVGPIHAGIIEPGHFRFSVMGESVLRLEERLGWKHKGIERRFVGMGLGDGARLAGRVSGDSTLAYAWAYCQAAEAIGGALPPPRALWLRALLLERERITNHLGDLGYLGNDVALAFGLMQFMRLKEDWIRLNASLFGHRLLMDRVVPGGVAVDLDARGAQAIIDQCHALTVELRRLKKIYDEHAGLQDRFLSTGRVTPHLAQRLGVIGLAGRASAQHWDLRCNHPCSPYDRLEPKMVIERNGDVAARALVRFAEISESIHLIHRIISDLPPGSIRNELRSAPGQRGFGWIEGWRGDVLVALETGADGKIRRCHCHDPSWQNWPALEHAAIDNIVPDFPLINKSFNLSYAGQDL
ncbi:MAG: NADH-quinone oxidoreductase subunit C [Propionivibrio sp.]|uniref:NADH-quinone oxidoreductase subunit C n=1 Tax=Candidatus Propionivibrio dominans TaxID=2954373 RepID=A0A9D7FER3_9RHOO|nr:NADH-quinone oxidoreductase subunit C [Candidatus Propionivibrio dominans]